MPPRTSKRTSKRFRSRGYRYLDADVLISRRGLGYRLLPESRAARDYFKKHDIDDGISVESRSRLHQFIIDLIEDGLSVGW